MIKWDEQPELVIEEKEPRCDICGEPDGPGAPDWNPETGNHSTCEITESEQRVLDGNR